MSLEVVKVALHATDGGVRALIYPKDRQRTKEQKLDEAARRALAGDRCGHFKGSWVDGKWKLGRRLPDQGW